MTQELTTIPALILAAGLSSRMGAFKPLLPLAQRPLIAHVLEALTASRRIAPLLVVTGHHAAELDAALPPTVTRVFNPDYARGEMLSSLKIGLQQLQSTGPNHAGFLLAFADQPAVLPRTISTLVERLLLDAPPVVLPTFQGRKGHPLVLSARLIPEIAALHPSDTLRTVIQKHLPLAALIPVDDPAILEDLDTPADLARAQARLSASAPVPPPTLLPPR
jgi:molybdenum cofactor cytidylyltransferase